MDKRKEKIQTTVLSQATDGGYGFIAYAHSRVEKLQEEGRHDAAIKLEGYIKRFAAYLGRNEIQFKEFDALLVRNYHTWLENRNLGKNTISLYIRNLKRIYKLAVTDGIATECHPFDGMDVSYRVKKEKKGLTLSEARRLHDLDLSGEHPSIAFARDIFLFSVYARGMRSDDIFRLTRENIGNGRLVYCQRLTGKEVSIPWKPMLQEIVDRYSRPDTPYLFPVITEGDAREQWKQYDYTLHGINRSLKKLGKMIGIDYPLNMTVAHHSWESITKSVNICDLL